MDIFLVVFHLKIYTHSSYFAVVCNKTANIFKFFINKPILVQEVIKTIKMILRLFYQVFSFNRGSHSWALVFSLVSEEPGLGRTAFISISYFQIPCKPVQCVVVSDLKRRTFSSEVKTMEFHSSDSWVSIIPWFHSYSQKCGSLKHMYTRHRPSYWQMYNSTRFQQRSFLCPQQVSFSKPMFILQDWLAQRYMLTSLDILQCLLLLCFLVQSYASGPILCSYVNHFIYLFICLSN